MKELSIQEKYSWFRDTVGLLGKFLLDSSGNDIEYNIFEEFDSDSISVLHSKTLDALLNAQYITQEIYDKSLELAKSFRALENTPLWNVSAVRTSSEWLHILSLADEIKSKQEKLKTNPDA